MTEIHRDYLRSGATVLTACTFRTHRRSLALAGLEAEVDELNRTAVAAARSAIEQETVPEARIAGSLSPLEDCFRPDLTPDDRTLNEEHRLQATSLAAAGVDLILVETMNCRREAVAAVRAAVATGLPVWLSLLTDRENRLLSGEPLAETVHVAEDLGAEAFLVNCVPVTRILSAVVALRRVTDLPVGAYGNIGHADDVDGWRVELMLAPDEFAATMRDCVGAGATIVGGCCGTEPRHIAALVAALSN